MNRAASHNTRDALLADDPESLGVVVARTQAGDDAAFRQLYDLCHGSVFRLAVRIVGRQEAVDVSQQVFLQVFRKIRQYRSEANFRTWLYQIAVNECLQHLRRAKRHKSSRLVRDPEVNSSITRVEQKEVFELALCRMDSDLRSLFVLREIEQLSYKQIADVLRIPEGTVGSRMNRARRELQRELSLLGIQV